MGNPEDKPVIRTSSGKTRMTLEQARKVKGQSNVARLRAEQLKEKTKKTR